MTIKDKPEMKFDYDELDKMVWFHLRMLPCYYPERVSGERMKLSYKLISMARDIVQESLRDNHDDEGLHEEFEELTKILVMADKMMRRGKFEEEKEE